MRCDEVTRELAAPTGRPDPAAMAAHLAACSRCASWADRAQQLDRLWDATRPPLPSWDEVWARVAHEADASRDRPAISLAPARPRARWAWVGLGLAQAAAVLIAVSIAIHRHPEAPKSVAPGAVVLDSRIEVEEGQTLTFHLDDQGVRVDLHQEDEAPPDATTVAVASGPVDLEVDLLNFGESIASATP